MNTPVFHFAHRFDHVSGSAIREIFKVIAQPGMISFAGGNPSLAALPDRDALFISSGSPQLAREYEALARALDVQP